MGGEHGVGREGMGQSIIMLLIPSYSLFLTDVPDDRPLGQNR